MKCTVVAMPTAGSCAIVEITSADMMDAPSPEYLFAQVVDKLGNSGVPIVRGFATGNDVKALISMVRGATQLRTWKDTNRDMMFVEIEYL